jgi:hypothetical protein
MTWIGLLLMAVLCLRAGAREPSTVTFQYSVDPITTSILKARRIHIILRNEGPADVSIIQIELRLDGDLVTDREDLSTPLLPCSDRIDPLRVEQQLASGKEVELIFQYPRGSFWLPLTNLDLMMFEPGSRKLEFRAQVQNPMTRSTAKIIKSVDLDVQAPTLAVTLGGAVGELFLIRRWPVEQQSLGDSNRCDQL